ncbi:MAG: hypothetical protein SYNGOMJ08_00650 [Candidatus Syntrophoarchaeum sp. GoM_oil]|nr:MAG: hypothetical protein SYNGOMJ08_00650 [Candidatus Syntrophoarchaeum sp. GoM_oil]
MMQTFRVIFVIDILNGIVVHAVGGEQDHYCPVHLTSGLVGSSDPISVINAVKPDETYIADLNAIMKTSKTSAHAPVEFQ